MIKIGLVEDISRIAAVVKEKIELSSDFKVQWIASHGREAIERLEKSHAIDVILMDINMPEMNGIDATSAIKKRWPSIPIIMSTVFDDAQNLFDAILAGASGYLLKDESPEKLHKSIFEALEGGSPMNPLIARKALQLVKGDLNVVKSIPEEFQLTTRELEILENLSKGLTYDQIGTNLFISYGTVRKHVENIYRKMEVHNKIEAIGKAKKSGLID